MSLSFISFEARSTKNGTIFAESSPNKNRFVDWDIHDVLTVSTHFLPISPFSRDSQIASAEAQDRVDILKVLLQPSSTPIQEFPNKPIAIANQAESDSAKTRNLHDSKYKKNNTYALIEVAPRFFFTRIDGTQRSNGAKGILLSDLNYGAVLSFNQVWSHRIHTFQSLGMNEIGFTAANVVDFTQNTQSYASMNAGIKYRPWRRPITLVLRGGANQEIFYRALNETLAKVDSVFITRLDLAFDQLIFKKGMLSLGWEVMLSDLFPSSTDAYSIDAGYAYQGKVYIRQIHQKRALLMENSIYYGETFQNTSILKETRKDLGIIFLFGWKL